MQRLVLTPMKTGLELLEILRLGDTNENWTSISGMIDLLSR